MRFHIFLFLVVTLIVFSGCEDEPPTDYIPKPYIQAYLLVGQPIEDIIVATTQPIDEAYDFVGSLVPDAEVSIEVDGSVLQLAYREDIDGGRYFCPDTTVLVEAETLYRLKVLMPDGTTVSAETTTPQEIQWTLKPAAHVQYPDDTTRLQANDSLRARWTSGNSAEYLVRVMVLDTINYGAYLEPATGESNTRTNSRGGKNDNKYSSTRWGYAASNRTRLAWTSFTWHGKNNVTIMAPDYWFLEWFKSVQFSRISAEYDTQESNVVGGIGVFGSASILSQDVFLLKNNR